MTKENQAEPNSSSEENSQSLSADDTVFHAQNNDDESETETTIIETPEASSTDSTNVTLLPKEVVAGEESSEDTVNTIVASGEDSDHEKTILDQMEFYNEDTVNTVLTPGKDPDHEKTILDQMEFYNEETQNTLLDENMQVAATKVQGNTVRRTINLEQRYRTSKTLGEGGMGTVLLVQDQTLQRNVAMKVIKKEAGAFAKRFIREARITGSLEHPNIIPIYDLVVAESSYFTMPMVKGVTLSDIIRSLSEGADDFAEYTQVRMLQIMLGICYALEYAHSHNVIHRDLKPDNIMIGPFGEVLVLDWGIAKKLGEQEPESSTEKPQQVSNISNADNVDATAVGSILGTPTYMSPEQVKGKNLEVDKLSDIYTLGTILFEMMTHRKMFQAKSLLILYNLITEGSTIAEKQNSQGQRIPREVMAIALKATSKDKKNRYPTVEAFRKDIQRFLEGRSVSAAPDHFIGRTIKLIRRHTGVSIAVAGATFVLLFLYHFYSVRISSAETQTRMLSLKNQEIVNVRVEQTKNYRQQLAQFLAQRRNLITKLQEGRTVAAAQHLETGLQHLEGKLAQSFDIIIATYQDILSLQKHTKQKSSPEISKGLAELYLMQAELLIFQQKREASLAAEKLVAKAQETSPDVRAKAERILQQISGRGSVNLIHDGKNDLLLYKYERSKAAWEQKETLPKATKTRELITGSYMLKTAEDSPFSFPFYLNPGEELAVEIQIPSEDVSGMVYIPKGRFITGIGVVEENLRERDKTFPFFIDQTEVTFGQYLNFYNAYDNEEHLPKIQLASGEWIPLFDEFRKLRFGLTMDSPVFGVTQNSALAYCKWRSQITGLDFDLPLLREWEKAARGVDGRLFPWGNDTKAAASNVKTEMVPGRVQPVEKFPEDTSVYGVKDMAGNVAEWTKNTIEDEAIVKGSHFDAPIDYAKLHIYTRVPTNTRGYIGFRCVLRSVD